MIHVKELSGLPVSELVSKAVGTLLPLAPEPDPSKGDGRRVGDLALHESGTTRDYTGRIVLVASRVTDRFALGQLLEEAGTAAALVLPPDATRDLALVGDHHPTLLRRSPWAEWSEVFGVLARTLGAHATGDSELQPDSLQRMAAWIASNTGTSVTIEDPSSQLLAYSVVGDDVDSVRSQTILRGAVPPPRLERLVSNGFLPAVWRSDDVVVREAEGDDPARMVLAVRAAGEILGTLWAALGPESDRTSIRSVLLAARATTAALLVRELHRGQHERRIREAALADLLRGGHPPGIPASVLGLDWEHRHAVIAVGPDSPAGRDTVFHLQGTHPGAVAVPIDGDLMVIVPVLDGSATVGVLAEAVAKRLRRVPRARGTVVSLGPIACSGAELAGSAAVAADVLRATALHGSRGEDRAGAQVVTAEQVHDTLILVRVSQRLRPMSHELTTAVRALEAHDPELLATVREVIRSPGNLAAAARELGIHSNSLRYRLAKIARVAGIDLQDQQSRLCTSLALLLHNTETGASHSPMPPP